MSKKVTKPLARGAKYSKKDVMDLYSTFSIFDINGDGQVMSREIVDRIKKQSLKIPLSHVSFMRALDCNHDGCLTFDEVLRRYYPLATGKELKVMYRWAYPEGSPDEPQEETFKPTEPQIKEMRSLFRIYDRNGSGVLERQEVLELATTAGYDRSEIEALFRSADSNDDDVLSFDEFVQLMKYSYIS